ncbi:MAG TPA: NAD-glutamate dehydrogenase [Longimicrobiaceae bacterium]|jgi:glutamate dehydrogenase|nr:NAD-glutamate dehydrogenase [Longimicrobiaceae bacterium]
MSNPIPTPASTQPHAAATVDDLCAYLERAPRGDAPLVCAFARLFFAKVPRDLLAERSVPQLAALTLGAYDFLRRARPDRVNVELANPEDEGWNAPVTVIRAEVGDRPFIVDSIREYLAGEGLVIQHYAYPVFRVERGADGEPVSVAGPTAEGEGGLEALVHVEIPRVAEAERREGIAAEIRRRLADVVAATSDFAAMRDELVRTTASVDEYAARFPERAEEYAEIGEFLRWLGDGNFIFLGYRGYQIAGVGDDATVGVEPGSGMGILADAGRSTYRTPVSLAGMPEPFRARVAGGPLLIVSKANAESTVHRRARMDYVGLKKLDEQGRVTGERRFLGLFTSQAMAASAGEVPILRHKFQRILENSGARPGSHDYKEIVTILNSMPKEELFEASVEELDEEVRTVLGSLVGEGIRVVVRPDPMRGESSVMVILPGGRFSSEVRQRIGELLAARLGGAVRTYYLAMGSGDQARLHYYLSSPATAEAPDARELERAVSALVRSWEDRLAEQLDASAGQDEARRLAHLYGGAFGEEYRAANSPASAAHDVIHLEAMRQRGHEVAVHLRQPMAGEEATPGTTILKLYLSGARLVLSDFMPILEDAGVRVLEVDTFEVDGADLPQLMVYSFAVQTRDGQPIPAERTGILAEELLASQQGDAPKDPFNALVLQAGLRWREVDVLRTYANYASQIGAVPSRLAPVRALMAYPRVARLLVDLFAARLDPASSDEKKADALKAELLKELEAVSSLADDRALRRMMNLVEATVRTNYFRHGGVEPTGRSGGVPYISIKVRSADVEELKKSRLLYEVYVHSSRMEGVHLRGAPVSRGGIRWSDRPDDFRTEILGLVTTQVVKNATIVPSGSKGGFITKRVLPDRDGQMTEAAEQYKTLMRGLLDITDNLVDGKVVPPAGVKRLDGDDPYLVVAADKGTAHLSDVANGVAAEYGFWLGDAFASGGSQGYDHKEEGITARGAWECVKRHFREMGKDIQATPFTVAGVGDMSGDVFGNGMLLSEKIRLVAAFDHRHIFLDPDPQPAPSFAERKRMFALPRSSWEDYDRALLSPGGMIVPRGSKEIEITPEVRKALGIPAGVERLDGEGLIRAVLTAPVELLWNGGIGTYVKDRDETHADAGDTTNDPVRVNADELRCKVVGEGGNLGFTQRGRIAFAHRGGRINTDALDNSAGVDMSDHEVNLKILLNRVVTDGEMDEDGRNRLLESMTDQVSDLVLRNNVGQSLAVSLDEQRSKEAVDDFAALISSLEAEHRLDRAAEGFPRAEELRDSRGQGLTRPSLSVLLAHAKLQAKAALLASPVPDDAATHPYLVGYFPAAAVQAAEPKRLAEHRLRREIVTTELVNDLVNLMGSAFLHRISRDAGSDIPTVVRAWLVASRISGAPEIRADLEKLEGRYPSDTVYRWLLGLGRVLEATTHWVLGNVAPDAETDAVVEEARAGLATLRGNFAKFVAGEDRALFLSRLGELQDQGVERKLGERLITLRFLPQLLEMLHLSRAAGTEELRTARAYYAVSERFGTARLREGLRTAAGDDPWERRYAQALAEDVSRAQRAIAALVLSGAEGGDVEAAVRKLESDRAREIRAYRDLLAELKESETVPLAAYALAVRHLQSIAR